MWRDFSKDVEALVIFQGAQGYVTPSWYATKAETGKVVPTWNYLVVHAYGPLQVVDDAAWLRAFVTRLTDRFEAERADPWQVTDAPADFVEKQLTAIVGIEIPVTRLLGKWKASQNRVAADREGVVNGLRQRNAAGDLAMSESGAVDAGCRRQAPRIALLQNSGGTRSLLTGQLTAPAVSAATRSSPGRARTRCSLSRRA